LAVSNQLAKCNELPFEKEFTSFAENQMDCGACGVLHGGMAQVFFVLSPTGGSARLMICL
jgi:hypothetical protein